MSIPQKRNLTYSKPSTGKWGGCDGVHKGSGIFCRSNKLVARVFGAEPGHLGTRPPPWRDELGDDMAAPLYGAN